MPLTNKCYNNYSNCAIIFVASVYTSSCPRHHWRNFLMNKAIKIQKIYLKQWLENYIVIWKIGSEYVCFLLFNTVLALRSEIRNKPSYFPLLTRTLLIDIKAEPWIKVIHYYEQLNYESTFKIYLIEKKSTYCNYLRCIAISNLVSLKIKGNNNSCHKTIMLFSLRLFSLYVAETK